MFEEQTGKDVDDEKENVESFEWTPDGHEEVFNCQVFDLLKIEFAHFLIIELRKK